MANQTCKFCDQEPAAFLISELTTGETVYVGLVCLPPFVKTVWEDAGLPGLVIDIVEPVEGTASEDAGLTLEVTDLPVAAVDAGDPFLDELHTSAEAVNGHTETAETTEAAHVDS